MKLINAKKLPARAVEVILYLSMCLGNWYYLREITAYLTVAYFGENTALVFGNTLAAMLVGGFIFYLVISAIIRNTLHPMRLKGMNAARISYVFKLTLSAGFLVYGLLSLFYLITPVISLYGDLILRFIVLTLFVIGGFLYCKKSVIPDNRLGATAYAVFGAYFISYIIIVALKMLLYYWAGVI